MWLVCLVVCWLMCVCLSCGLMMNVMMCLFVGFLMLCCMVCWWVWCFGVVGSVVKCLKCNLLCVGNVVLCVICLMIECIVLIYSEKVGIELVFLFYCVLGCFVMIFRWWVLILVVGLFIELLYVIWDWLLIVVCVVCNCY